MFQVSAKPCTLPAYSIETALQEAQTEISGESRNVGSGCTQYSVDHPLSQLLILAWASIPLLHPVRRSVLLHQVLRQR